MKSVQNYWCHRSTIPFPWWNSKVKQIWFWSFSFKKVMACMKTLWNFWSRIELSWLDSLTALVSATNSKSHVYYHMHFGASHWSNTINRLSAFWKRDEHLTNSQKVDLNRKYTSYATKSTGTKRLIVTLIIFRGTMMAVMGAQSSNAQVKVLLCIAPRGSCCAIQL